MATYQVRIDENGQKVLSAPLSGLGSNLATSELPGAVQPDNVTTKVDSAGVLSSVGASLLMNDAVTITESGDWTVPVTGWFDILFIFGGSGSIYYENAGYGRSGHAGRRIRKFVYCEAGTVLSFLIGAGGVGAAINTSDSHTSTYGGSTYISSASTTIVQTTVEQINWASSIVISQGIGGVREGSGPDGGMGNLPTAPSGHNSSFDGVFPGGGAAFGYDSNLYNYGNGAPGAAIIRFWNPTKANGSLVE